MIVEFNNMNGFLVNGYKLLYESLMTGDRCFTFDNYVKSQIHLPFLPDLYNRDIFLYEKAYRYLKGEEKYLDDTVKVIEFFYSDILRICSNLLKKVPSTEMTITVIVDMGRDTIFPKVTKSLEEVRGALEGILQRGENFDGPYAGVFSNFSNKEMLSLESNNVLALAAILAECLSNKNETVILEVLK